MRARQFLNTASSVVNGSITLSGRKIVTIGDSIMAGNYEITSVGGSTASPAHAAQRGFLNWFSFLTGVPIACRFENYNGTTVGGNNFATAGDSLTNILTRLSDALNQDPDILYGHWGTNDITAGLSAESILDGYRWAISKSIERGVFVWLNTILPRTILTAPQEAVRVAVNAGLRSMEQEFKGSLLVFDFDAMPTSLLSDGTHPNADGGEWMARNVIIPKLGAFYGIQKIRRSIPADFNATTSPKGNLITNSDFTGTGGTATGTGISGVVPDSWTFTRTDGTSVTGVSAVEALTDWNGITRNFVRALLTSTGAGVDNETIRWNPTATITTNVVAGQWYVCEVEVLVPVVASGANILRSVYVELRDNGTNGPVSRAFNVGFTDASSNKEYFPTSGGLMRRLLLRTFPICARTTSGLVLRLNADCDGSLSGSRIVYFGKPVLAPISFVQDFGLPNQYEVPAAAGTVAVRSQRLTNLIMNPAGTLATLTVVMPPLPQNGDVVSISTSQAITALTLTSGKTVNGTITTLAANAFATWMFNSTADRWFRVG